MIALERKETPAVSTYARGVAMAFADRFTSRLYHSEQLSDPGFVKTVFGSPKMALPFLALRVYLGWQWLHFGLLKISDPAWIRSGATLQRTWETATRLAAGQKGAPIHYGWYHDFLAFMLAHHWYVWFAKLVAFGETAMGIAFIIGAFVGISAFFGALANFNYMLAGNATINPVLFGVALLLIAGWKVAGYLGADYYLLPLFGTPWKPGHVIDVAREPGVEPRQVIWSVLGVLSWFGSFGLAAAAAVLANHQWDKGQPVVGYLVTVGAVLIAWIIGEALLTATHTQRPRSASTSMGRAMRPVS
jgi:thiosulfate dehydrogenase (quinone) large subunit